MVNNKDVCIGKLGYLVIEDNLKKLQRKWIYFEAEKLFSCIEINYLLYLMLV